MRFITLFIAAAALRLTVEAAPAPPPPQAHTGGTEAAFPPNGLPGVLGKTAGNFPLNTNLGANAADTPVAGVVVKSLPLRAKTTSPATKPGPPQKRQLQGVSPASLPLVGDAARALGGLGGQPGAGGAPPPKKRQFPSVSPASLPLVGDAARALGGLGGQPGAGGAPPPKKRQFPSVSPASLPLVGDAARALGGLGGQPGAGGAPPPKKRQIQGVSPSSLPVVSDVARALGGLGGQPGAGGAPPPKKRQFADFFPATGLTSAPIIAQGFKPSPPPGGPAAYQKRATKGSSRSHATQAKDAGAPADLQQDTAPAATGQDIGSLEKAEQAVDPGVKGTVKNADDIVAGGKAAAVKNADVADVAAIDRTAGKAASAAETATGKIKGTVQEAENAGLAGPEDGQQGAPASAPENASPAETGHKGLFSKLSGLLHTGGQGPQ